MTVELLPPRPGSSCSSCNTGEAVARLSIGDRSSRQVVRLCAECLDRLGWCLVDFAPKENKL